jgi:Na+/proline symporter
MGNLMNFMQTIDPLWVCLVAYLALTLIATSTIGSKYKHTNEGFCVSDRNAPVWMVATSAASSWLWVLGLLLIGRFAVESGPAGVLWSYGLPFLGTAVLFGYFAKKLVGRFPNGLTLNSFINHRYQNKKLTMLYQFLQIAACVYAVSGTLTSFGIVAEFVSKDFNYNVIVSIVAITVLAYSLWGGQKACHRTDVINILFLLFISVLAGFYIVDTNGGLGEVYSNWTSARNLSFFDLSLMWNNGMFLALIFVGSFLADNMQYQNAFSLGDKNKTVKAYWLASFILLVVIAGISLITGSVFTADPNFALHPDLVQMHMIKTTFGISGVIFFMLTVLFKASSVIDSTLNGAGTVISNDVMLRSNPLTVNRLSMVMIMAISTLIAILRIDIWVLVSTFGLLRIIMISPTVYAVYSKKIISTNLLFYTLFTTTILGIGSTFFAIPIDRATLGLVVFLIPALVIAYEHKKAKQLRA